MEYARRICDRLSNSIHIAGVFCSHVHHSRVFLEDPIEITLDTRTRHVVKNDHRDPARQQPVSKVRSDKTGSARYQGGGLLAGAMGAPISAMSAEACELCHSPRPLVINSVWLFFNDLLPFSSSGRCDKYRRIRGSDSPRCGLFGSGLAEEDSREWL